MRVPYHYRESYCFIVVVEQRLDGLLEICSLICMLEVDGEIDSIDKPIEEKGLVYVEGEAMQYVSTLQIASLELSFVIIALIRPEVIL